MPDLLERIVDVIITRQTTVPSMRSFSEHLFVDEFDPTGTRFADRRVIVIGSPEELITAGLSKESAAYRAAVKQFSQSPRIRFMYVGCKQPNDASWTVALSEIKKRNDGFYAISTCARTMAEQQQIALWTEANQKLYGIESGDPQITDEETGDIASWAKLFNLDRSFVFFHPDSAPGADGKITDGDHFPAAALFGKVLTFQPGSATWMFKDLNAVPTYELDTDKFNTATNKNAMLYCRVADVPITFWGKVSSGEYIDIIHGCDWLRARIMNKVFTVLKKHKKVPFTDVGITWIDGALRSALQEGVDLAGLLETYTIHKPLASNIPASEKANRNLSMLDFEGPVQGAIHTTRIRGNVTL